MPPESRVLASSSLVDDAVFRTGGTTAVPKASYVIREWRREGAKAWATCFVQAGLLPDDPVANLLENGDHCKGLLDRSLVLTHVLVQACHLAIRILPLDC